MGLLKKIILGIATGGASLAGEALGVGGDGMADSEASLLKPDAGLGDVMSQVIKRQAQQKQWQGNPLNQLANTFTFGLVKGPGSFTAQQLYGTTDLNETQSDNLMMANYLLGGK